MKQFTHHMKKGKNKRCLSLADSDDSDDETIYAPHKKREKNKRHLSLADNDDSDDDSTQPSQLGCLALSRALMMRIRRGIA